MFPHTGGWDSIATVLLIVVVCVLSGVFVLHDTCVFSQPTDQGSYSCHLHHHYCGLHERREFQVTVEAPLIHSTVPAKALPSEDKGNAHKHTHIYKHL